MERLQKWLGGANGKSSELKVVTGSSTMTVKQDGAVADSVVATESASGSNSVHASEKKDDKAPRELIAQQNLGSGPTEGERDAKVTETRVGQLLNEGREMILRVVPLTEGDCLSCKLIGSATLWGAAGFVLYSYPKYKMNHPGFKRKLFALQVMSLASGLTLLGVARFFDLSIFSPPDAEGKRKSLAELVAEDMDTVSKYTKHLFSSNTVSDSDSKTDS